MTLKKKQCVGVFLSLQNISKVARMHPLWHIQMTRQWKIIVIFSNILGYMM